MQPLQGGLPLLLPSSQKADFPTWRRRLGVEQLGLGDWPTPAPRNADWRPPDFVDLSAARTLAFDVETHDPHLREFGPGWARGNGAVVGVSVASNTGFRGYFPLAHYDVILDRDDVRRWLTHALADPRQPKVGANLVYDVGWLGELGVEVRGPLWDVQYAEALLAETGDVSLDALGRKYVGTGKVKADLEAWLRAAVPMKPSDDMREHLWRAPACLVGPYAEQDAALPIEVLKAQWPLLESEGLLPLFRLECELIPLYVAMRRLGVRVDRSRAVELRDSLLAQESAAQARLDALFGAATNVHSASELAVRFAAIGVEAPRTERGNPSFTEQTLGQLGDAGARVLDVRKLHRLRSTFIESYLLDAVVGERLHCQFHPLRGESKGTRSGRYSSSSPNLQNIPARRDLAKPIRRLFIPEEGARWVSIDYSQVEYRLLLHYAEGGGADEARAHYAAHPDTDYHALVQEQVARMGAKLTRKAVKGVNFGLIYGMGRELLAAYLPVVGKAEVDAFFESYFAASPYIRSTMDIAMRELAGTGTVTTVLGRKSRFQGSSHKALNRRLQGSAADLLKAALHKALVDGVFDVIGAPHITVHDELDLSHDGSAAARDGFRELKRIMETALPLRVPIRADVSMGPNWGDLEAVAL